MSPAEPGTPGDPPTRAAQPTITAQPRPEVSLEPLHNPGNRSQITNATNHLGGPEAGSLEETKLAASVWLLYERLKLSR